MGGFHVAVHGLIEEHGRILVVRRAASERFMPLRWDLPGGAVSLGEDTTQALEREVMEETGLRVAVGAPALVHTNLDQLPARQTVQILFHCRRLTGELRLDPAEHDAWRWVGSRNACEGELMPYLAAYFDRHIAQANHWEEARSQEPSPVSSVLAARRD
ncbi:MAG: NUDIX domain-containing protein [Myxococcales bacterium]|nr:NUDIX domain-containing protein [Myxococcales bacterium]